MLAVKQILFPIDLSVDNAQLAKFVADAANLCGASVTLLHVVPDLRGYGAMYVSHPSLSNVVEHIAEGAGERMAKFAQEHLGAVPEVSTRVVIGNVAEQIVKFAKKQGMDMIVMGTHGRKGLELMLLGSVAEKVVRTSSVPVLTVNPYRD